MSPTHGQPGHLCSTLCGAALAKERSTYGYAVDFSDRVRNTGDHRTITYLDSETGDRYELRQVSTAFRHQLGDLGHVTLTRIYGPAGALYKEHLGWFPSCAAAHRAINAKLAKLEESDR